MPSVTVRIPDSIRKSGYIEKPATAKDQEWIAAAVKARLAAILTRAEIETPKRAIMEVSVHASIWLNAADHARLVALGVPNELSIGEVITALLLLDAFAVAAERSRASETPKVPPKWPQLQRALHCLGLSERPEQTRFYGVLQTFADTPRPTPAVLFAEAGTGVGKTLAYLMATYSFLHDSTSAKPALACAALAVPTFALMDQAMHEWARLQKARGRPIATATLVGQGEFVSVQALRTLADTLDDPDLIKRIAKWIAAGGPSPNGALIRSRWTVASLKRIAPDLPHVDSITLTNRDDDEDEGYLAYREQWERLPQCSMIVMTHAMLASLVRKRLVAQGKVLKSSKAIKEAVATWSATVPARREQRLYEVLNSIYADADIDDGLDSLPDLDWLVVDEAHGLEDAFSRVLSQRLSLSSLRNDLQKLHERYPRQVSAAAVSGMDTMWQQMQEHRLASPDNVLPLHSTDRVALAGLADILHGVVKIKASAQLTDATFRRVAQVARSVDLALSVGERSEGSIDWSPNRKWPRLSVGRLNLSRELHYLWTVVAQRSVLVSGTLYEEVPQLSCESLRRILAVPFEAQVTMEPVHASWQNSLVTACIISSTSAPDGRARFVRPTPSKGVASDTPAVVNEYAAWVGDIGAYLVEAHRVAVGGMLVLGTAFADLAAVSAWLAGHMDAPILVHQKGVALANLREQYLSYAREGVRPVLLAVGGAWTGFDLHCPENANALTDLVVLNAPFGAIARTMSREERVRRANGFYEVIAQCLLLLRQGVGRIVRSPDTPPNRRIHWLDARIHRADMSGLFNPIKRFFTKYKIIEV